MGVLERQDAALIEGVFEFSEKNAREVMTPRTAIDALDIDATLDEAVALVVETQRSRYPVFEESIDNIVGLVLAKDFIPLLRGRPRDFTMEIVLGRVEAHGDLYAPVLEDPRPLGAASKKLARRLA